MERYDIHDDILFDMHPGYGEAMVRNPEGRYVKYEDVIEMLDRISKSDTDMSPRMAVINYVFEEFQESQEAVLKEVELRR